MFFFQNNLKTRSLKLLRKGEIAIRIVANDSNFVDGQGNLERTWRVREKSGNMKINGYCGLQKLYLFC